MKKTSTARIFASSILETIWATGVGSVVGHLSTKTHSSHNKANSLGLPKAAPLVPRYAALGIR